ncbi:MAG: Rossman fold protein, TIGR00730 family [Candidatus Nealsonbacteria bacterium RIFCSPLOWO2_01_FULL_41_9]|uniref:Cytokinin riboside 5'-monophosphate phosphoribohydrolase n=1 Tax=Candidatus Nealsonbacteria bacterium RIFCSPLOWO2_01_FULL_41_9 TaxID=1801671 RepID=A0A1G2E9I4_9BACT|nr:MAG: Rossman fold protein, TIGR00730 family [Candidatus Nealsonbacteria bacterium RIFCSPLOWO2_01_FULL_41_9]
MQNGKRISKITAEFKRGFNFVSGIKKAVAILGSTRAPEKDRYYQEARKLAIMLAKAGYAVITGGGPGIMEAANKGALEGGGESVALNIKLREWQKINRFVKKSIGFDYLFVRKVMFSFAAPIYIFFPGGYGTLDEFFEMIMLVQTKEIRHPVLVITVDKNYWTPLFSWLKKEVYKKRKAISKNDLKIFHLVDSAKEAFELVKRHGNH